MCRVGKSYGYISIKFPLWVFPLNVTKTNIISLKIVKKTFMSSLFFTCNGNGKQDFALFIRITYHSPRFNIYLKTVGLLFNKNKVIALYARSPVSPEAKRFFVLSEITWFMLGRNKFTNKKWYALPESLCVMRVHETAQVRLEVERHSC